MAKEGYQAKALLALLTELAAKKGYLADRQGLAKYERSSTLENAKVVIKDRYLVNRFDDYKKEVENDPEAIVKPRTDYFDLIASEAGYQDLKDYLVKNNFPLQSEQRQTSKRNTDYLLRRNPPHPNEFIDKYVLGARVMPTFLGLFPFAATMYFAALAYPGERAMIAIFGCFLWVGLAFALAQHIAAAGKKYDSKLFFKGGKKGFSTVTMMLYSHLSYFTMAQKEAYREKATAYFGIDFPSREEEEKDDEYALQKLREAAVRVNKTVKSVVIRSALTKHGFHRNLIPASLMGMALSIASLGYGIWEGADTFFLVLQSVMFLGFCAYFLTHKRWVVASSEAYARYLIQEFLSR